MRLFASIDLPGVADAVAALQDEFRPADGLRFTDPDQTHVTLKFLGDTDPSRLDSVQAALDRAVQAVAPTPFEATVEGLGAFPSEEYINVIWVGVTPEEDGVITQLHEAIEAEFVDIGFDPEAHEFTPHATIARMDHAGEKARVQDLLATRDPVLGTQAVDAIHLTESTLTDDGPVYDHVHSISLE